MGYSISLGLDLPYARADIAAAGGGWVGGHVLFNWFSKKLIQYPQQEKNAYPALSTMHIYTGVEKYKGQTKVTLNLL